jgi:hypothetical protein
MAIPQIARLDTIAARNPVPGSPVDHAELSRWWRGRFGKVLEA